MINYDEDRYGDDVIFSSHTSIVTKKLIDLKLSEKFSDYEPIKDEAKPNRKECNRTTKGPTLGPKPSAINHQTAAKDKQINQGASHANKNNQEHQRI